MRSKSGKIALNFFYTKFADNSGKLRQNSILWQKLYRFTDLSKLHCTTWQFSGGTNYYYDFVRMSRKYDGHIQYL